MMHTTCHSKHTPAYVTNESMVLLQQCCNMNGKWETETAIGSANPLLEEQEGAGGNRKIENMGLILAALRRIETETSKVTHDALKQQKQLDFEGFKMEERLSSYSARHTGMQLNSSKGEKQLAEPWHQGQHESKERGSQHLHRHEDEGEKYCGTGELVAEANDSEVLEKQVKQIQKEAQKQAEEAERQKKAQSTYDYISAFS